VGVALFPYLHGQGAKRESACSHRLWNTAVYLPKGLSNFRTMLHVVCHRADTADAHRAQSHLMRCSDGHDYIVKFQNNPQHRRILVNQLLGTRLAGRLGLPITPVAIVHVSEELIRLTPELSMEMPRSRIPCQAGLQFGSRYPGGPRRLRGISLRKLFARLALKLRPARAAAKIRNSSRTVPSSGPAASIDQPGSHWH
jgi:hypothetical protein